MSTIQTTTELLPEIELTDEQLAMIAGGQGHNEHDHGNQRDDHGNHGNRRHEQWHPGHWEWLHHHRQWAQGEWS